MVKTSLDVDPDLWRRFRIRAIEEGVKLHELLRRALEAQLKTKPGGKLTRLHELYQKTKPRPRKTKEERP